MTLHTIAAFFLSFTPYHNISDIKMPESAEKGDIIYLRYILHFIYHWFELELCDWGGGGGGAHVTVNHTNGLSVTGIHECNTIFCTKANS